MRDAVCQCVFMKRGIEIAGGVVLGVGLGAGAVGLLAYERGDDGSIVGRAVGEAFRQEGNQPEADKQNAIAGVHSEHREFGWDAMRWGAGAALVGGLAVGASLLVRREKEQPKPAQEQQPQPPDSANKES